MNKRITPTEAEAARVARQVLEQERKRITHNQVSSKATERARRVAADPTAQAEPTGAPCEACNRNTYWTVLVIDRRARWCGCA